MASAASRRCILRSLHLFFRRPWSVLTGKLDQNYMSSFTSAYAIMNDEHGDPRKVLSGRNITLSAKLKDDEVLVKMLMAPINPADINMIEGTYHIMPKLPAIGGNEGVGEVLEVGPAVKCLSPGDWVIPADPGWGTWRTHAVAPFRELQKIDNKIPVLSAATIAVNPCTAYRMLKDFVHLKPGDAVIQNSANSAVGQNVIQIARQWKIKTINIIRDRPDKDSLVKYLKDLGATHVVTEEFTRLPEMRDLIKTLETPPKLALNGVGGKSATELIRHIGQKGVMVTYGGMAKQPVTIPIGALIFKEVSAVGFWNSKWNAENKNNPAKEKMLEELCEMIKDCKLMPPKSDLLPLTKYQEAVASAMEGYKGQKKVFVMDDNMVLFP
ncbi:hypothetical protein ACJMK2_028624 [Sinanodonta woodiana]|uniref:Enoyl-[acyl-carrier-protein] reductase, mitochondrial n=1 Tax=Sinanodonta woodiana TaxID=1069815 RepID=A0ABD3XB84_SINWO